MTWAIRIFFIKIRVQNLLFMNILIYYTRYDYKLASLVLKFERQLFPRKMRNKWNRLATDVTNIL